MKKFFKFSLVALALLTATVAQADEMELLVKVAKENSKWVSFATNQALEIDLTLYTADEEVIYEQQIKTVGNKFKTYDLTALPEGNYVLKMASKAQVATYKIEITDDNAVVTKVSVVEVKKPSLVKQDNIVTLNLNGSCKGEVEVAIYNEFNEKLHEDVFADQSKVITKFDVSRTPSRELTFVIRSANHEFAETVKL
jgi:hypothetical protein